MVKGKRERRTSGRMPGRKAVRVLLALALCCAGVLAVYRVWRSAATPPQEEPAPAEQTETALPEEESQPAEGNRRRENCYTFLLAASDQSSGNADVIIAVTYDIAAQRVGAVSIPRDTLVDPDRLANYPKINSSYGAGIDRLEAVASDLLGIVTQRICHIKSLLLRICPLWKTGEPTVSFLKVIPQLFQQPLHALLTRPHRNAQFLRNLLIA